MLGNLPDPRPSVCSVAGSRDPVALKVIRATALARAGYISRAAKALSQDGLQPASNEVVEKLSALHPRASGPPPPCPETVPHVAVDTEALAKTISQRLKNGAAPGPSGWTGELIAPLVDDSECLDGLGLSLRISSMVIWMTTLAH